MDENAGVEKLVPGKIGRRAPINRSSFNNQSKFFFYLPASVKNVLFPVAHITAYGDINTMMGGVGNGADFAANLGLINR